jgi:hypothetical protein
MLRIFRHYVSGLVFVLFLGDLAVLLGALYVTELSAPWAGYAPFGARFVEVAVVVAFILYLGDLYQLRQASARLWYLPPSASPSPPFGSADRRSLRSSSSPRWASWAGARFCWRPGPSSR